MSTPDSTRTGRAVRLDRHGGVDQLYLAEVAVPDPRPGRVLVEVHATGIHPVEAAVREGAFAGVPAGFPSGQGSDWAGTVVAVGDGVEDLAPGDDVFGRTGGRDAHATHVEVPAGRVLPRPAGAGPAAVGGLPVPGAAAVAAVHAVDPRPGETVVVSGAAGDAGRIAVQLLLMRDVEVVGIAPPADHDRLRAMGVTPAARDTTPARTLDDVRAAAPDTVHAWADLRGGDAAMARRLGVPPARIGTVTEQDGEPADGAAAREDLAALADLVGDGALEVPVAAAYPLGAVREAFTELERRPTAGAIVLLPRD